MNTRLKSSRTFGAYCFLMMLVACGVGCGDPGAPSATTGSGGSVAATSSSSGGDGGDAAELCIYGWSDATCGCCFADGSIQCQPNTVDAPDASAVGVLPSCEDGGAP